MSAAELGIREPTQAAAGRASRYQTTDGSTAINKPADDIHMSWEVSITQSIQLHQSTVVGPYDLGPSLDSSGWYQISPFLGQV